MAKNGITVEYEPEFREYHVVEWYENVGTILYKTNSEEEANDWAATYVVVEQWEITNTFFTQWD